jgi:hypothetical protein
VGLLHQRLLRLGLWDRDSDRKRFALPWRTKAAVREVAHDVAWTAAASLDRIVPSATLARRSAPPCCSSSPTGSARCPTKEVSYPINHAITRMLDWLIQHQPEQARAVVAEIVGEAERALSIPPAITGYSLRQALALDGEVPDENAYAEFLDLVLPPDS